MKLSWGKSRRSMKRNTEQEPVDKREDEKDTQWNDEQIKNSPNAPEPYIAKAIYLTNNGCCDEALPSLDKIIELDPNNEKAWYLKASTLFELQRYEEAIGCYDRILEFASNDERTWCHKGEALLELELYKNAKECFDTAVQLDQNSYKAWLGRGHALSKICSCNFKPYPETLDESTKAGLEDTLESYDRATKLNRQFEEAWEGKGHVLYCLGRYEEALTCYEKCTEIKSDSATGWYGKGKVLQNLEKEDEAQQAFINVINSVQEDSQMNDPHDLTTKANAFYELNRYEEALECFDNIIKMNPGDHNILERRACVLDRLDRKEDALLCFKNVLELNPESVCAWYGIATILSEVENYDAALECYNKAVQLEPRYEEAWYRVGELLRILDEIEKANQCFSWILEINPNNEKAKNALQSLTEDNENTPKPIESKRKMVQKKDRKKRRRKLKKKANKSSADTLDERNDVPESEIGEKATPDIYNEFKERLFELEEAFILDNDESETETEYAEENVSPKTNGPLEYLVDKGREYIGKKDFSKAMMCFDKALEMDNGYSEAWSAKGDAFIEMGQVENASQCFKKAMD